LDYAGAARIISSGPDTGTRGWIKLTQIASDGSSYSESLTIDPSANVKVTNGQLIVGVGAGGGAGDLCVGRGGAPTTGVVYFGNSGAKYLYYDGTQFNLTAQLSISGSLGVSGNCNITGQYQVNGTPIPTTSGAITNFSKPSRALGTTYQNTTGKPMFVTVTMQCLNSTGSSAYCDTANPPTTRVAATSTGGSGASTWTPMSFWVLPGYFYLAQNNGGTLVDWTEWW
jgi:hypothetical protein